MRQISSRFVPGIFAALVFAALSSITQAHAASGFWVTPAVPGYGVIHVWPHEVSRPSPRASYKAVFYIPQAIAKKSKADPELGRIARMVDPEIAPTAPHRSGVQNPIVRIPLRRPRCRPEGSERMVTLDEEALSE